MQERVKRRTNVTVDLDAALVAAARAKGIDLNSLFETALASHLMTGEPQTLSDEDRASMESYNRYVAEHGTLADAFRKL